MDVFIKQISQLKELVAGDDAIGLIFTDGTSFKMPDPFGLLLCAHKRKECPFVQIFKSSERIEILVFGREMQPSTITFCSCYEWTDKYGLYDILATPQQWCLFWQKHILKESQIVIDERTTPSVILKVNRQGQIMAS